MRLTRRGFLAWGSLVAVAPGGVSWAADDVDYHALSLRILRRIDALRYDFADLAWPKVDEARVAADGSCGFAIEHAVQWVTENPDEPASHFNALTAHYGPRGFYAHLTLYRGAWTGAAVFNPIDFSDLHAWFESGTGDDRYTAVIVAIATILAEESRRVPTAGRALL